MKRFIIFIFVFSSFYSILCFAQNPPEFNPETLFSDFDYSGMTTAFLLDKAKEPVALKHFTGRELTDSNFVSPIALKYIYETIQDADTLSNRYWPSLTFSDNHSEAILNTVLYRYDYLQPESLRQQSISYDGLRIRRTRARSSPFETETVFAFAPSRSLFHSLNVSFETNILGDGNIPNAQVYIDAGDGTGYHLTHINVSYYASYDSPGMKEITLKAVYGGNTLYSHSYIYISLPSNSPAGSGPISPYKLDTISVLSNDGRTVRAFVETDYANSGSSLTRPLIYVEGFDPVDLTSFLSTGQKKLGVNSLTPGLLYSLRQINSNCDIVYINWDNSEEDIRTNAKLLKEIILTVNQIKHQNGSNEENILMAHSMGGLISQYALSSMERDNVNHEVGTFISQDVPFLGVHIPVGAMYAIREVFSYVDSTVGDIIDLCANNIYSHLKNSILKYLNGTSAKQMLYDYVEENCSVTQSYHTAFLDTLQTIGLPQGSMQHPVQNLAIINGGTTNVASELSANSNHYLNVNGDLIPSHISQFFLNYISSIVTFILDPAHVFKIVFYLPGSAHIHYSLAINSDRDTNGERMHFSGIYVKNCLFINFYDTLIESIKTTGGHISHLEESPGSLLRYEINGSPQTSYDDWVQSSMVGSILDLFIARFSNLSITTIPGIMFVPTESALAAKNPNYSRNPYYSPLTPKSDTPFDAYMVTDSTNSHANLIMDPSWLQAEIYGPTVLGDTSAVTGSTYTLSSTPPGAVNGTWSTTNPNYATINQSGVLTVHRGGPIEVSYSYYNQGKYYRYKKKVVAHSNSSLTSVRLYLNEHVNNGSIYVSAMPVDDSDMVLWEDLLNDPNIRENLYYTWKWQKDWGPITIAEDGYLDDFIDETTLFPEISVMPLLRDAQYRIYTYLEIKDLGIEQGLDHISAGKSMIVSDLNALLWPRSFIISPEGYFWVDDNSIHRILPGDQLRINCDPDVDHIIITGENDNVLFSVDKSRDGLFDLFDGGYLENYFRSFYCNSNKISPIHIRLVGKDKSVIENKVIPLIIKGSLYE